MTTPKPGNVPVRTSAKRATSPGTSGDAGAAGSDAGGAGNPGGLATKDRDADVSGPAAPGAADSDRGDSGRGDSHRVGSTSAAAAPRPAVATGPRRVRLSISRVDPWSVMKLGFLLSVALGIMTVVAAAVAWNVVDSMGVFADLESLLTEVGAIEQFRLIMEYLRLKNIMSMAVVISIVNVALMTALATLGAFLYNIVAALVGGLHMTLTDD